MIEYLLYNKLSLKLFNNINDNKFYKINILQSLYISIIIRLDFIFK